MDILSIPFNQFLGLTLSDDPAYLMTLPAKGEYENHLQTVHAGALFALAEASSGLYLLREFSEVKNTIPVVRNAEVKYKKPAVGAIFSQASLEKKKADVLATLENRRLVLIPVRVSLYDAQAVMVMEAVFEWFVFREE